MRLKNIKTGIKCFALVCGPLLFSTTIFAQSDNRAYNKALADSLGSDDYGMKNMCL